MNFVRLPFEAVFADESGGNLKTPQSDYLTTGTFPIVDQGKALIGGYVNDPSRICGDGRSAIVFGDHTRCIKFIDFPFCMGADGVKVLRPKIAADLKYLYYYLLTLKLPDAGYDRHYKYLKRTELVLPPLQEQRRIAAILDQAEALRTKRREALAKLDDLQQAIFIEMFGDPARNSKGWNLQPLGSIAVKFSDGPFGSNLKSAHYVDNGIRVIRLQNIGVGIFLDEDKAFVSPQHYETIKKHECKPGDVVVGTMGNPNLRACILPPGVTLAINKADCVQIRVNSSLADATFICSLLNHPSTEALAHELKHGQTRVRISMGSLRGLKVPIPPLENQQTFSRRMAELGLLRSMQEEARKEINRLFESLQDNAFNSGI